jgi:hypothetical protein
MPVVSFERVPIWPPQFPKIPESDFKLRGLYRWMMIDLVLRFLTPDLVPLDARPLLSLLQNVVFRVARCRNYESRPLRWTLQYRVRWPKGWVVAVRLDEKNEAIFDYVLMPSTWLTFNRRMFLFSKEAYKDHTINRFDKFEALSRFLIERVGKEKPSRDVEALPRTVASPRKSKGA